MLNKMRIFSVLLVAATIVKGTAAQEAISTEQSAAHTDTTTIKSYQDPQNSLPLTLDDVLTIALSENPLVKVANKEVIKSEYAKKGTYASLFPKVDATANYQYTVKKQSMVMDFAGETMNIEVGTTHNITGGFSLAMPLISPILWQSLDISALEVELAVEKARSSRVDMIEQASKAFYGVLLAIDSYNLYAEVYNNTLENYLDVKQKFEVGSISEYEMIRANVQVKNTLPNLYTAEHSIALAKWQLKALIGMDLDGEISCIGSLGDYASDMIWRRAELRLENNSSLLQMDIQDRQLAKVLKMKKAENYPTLNLGFNYNWLAMDDVLSFKNMPWSPFGVASFSLSVPIFNGGKRRHDIKQAKIDIEQMALQRENAIKNLEVAWLQHTNAMDVSIHKYDVAKSSVAEAKKGYDIAVARFDVGKGTQLDVQNSQLQLLQAELSKSSAIYDYLVSKVSLEALSGEEK